MNDTEVIEETETDEEEPCEAMDCEQPATIPLALKNGRVVWLCIDHYHDLGVEL